jgi:uncharacterized membrane protein YkvA (DUF1232 family)
VTTGWWWLDGLIGIAAALAVCWLLLIGALLRGRRHGAVASEAFRLLPDLVRLLRRLATDHSIALGVRALIWGLLIYLALPIDLVPDFIPVLGYADDVILAVLVLRRVIRKVGLPALRAHWPGTDDGFNALTRLTKLGQRSR